MMCGSNFRPNLKRYKRPFGSVEAFMAVSNLIFWRALARLRVRLGRDGLARIREHAGTTQTHNRRCSREAVAA
jgi:hypothetical protein